MDNNKLYINSKITCPVCAMWYAKNYLLVHLKKQHSNIYGTTDWDSSRYAKYFIEIKRAHRKLWGINDTDDDGLD
jgi:hypothetical protein